MKKIIFVGTAVLIGLVTVLYLNEYIKGLIASALLDTNTGYSFNGIIITAYFPLTGNHAFLFYCFLFSIPILISLIFIEASAFSLKKITNLNLRTEVIIFELINIGFVIVNIFVGIITVLFKNSFENGWARLFQFSGYSFEKQLIIVFLSLALTLAYVNFTANRLRNYLTIIKEK